MKKGGPVSAACPPAPAVRSPASPPSAARQGAPCRGAGGKRGVRGITKPACPLNGAADPDAGDDATVDGPGGDAAAAAGYPAGAAADGCPGYPASAAACHMPSVLPMPPVPVVVALLTPPHGAVAQDIAASPVWGVAVQVSPELVRSNKLVCEPLAQSTVCRMPFLSLTSACGLHLHSETPGETQVALHLAVKPTTAESNGHRTSCV
mmetsp:Transcript_119478/g.381188  ORF Transcript_119478/g.381188 Transcript_119478/m.381188 type:complete len:207 (-) Transcript_119478:1755-2375(-)